MTPEKTMCVHSGFPAPQLCGHLTLHKALNDPFPSQLLVAMAPSNILTKGH